jgi:hypothetical protein
MPFVLNALFTFCSTCIILTGLYDVIYEAENALCDINKHHFLQLNVPSICVLREIFEAVLLNLSQSTKNKYFGAKSNSLNHYDCKRHKLLVQTQQIISRRAAQVSPCSVQWPDLSLSNSFSANFWAHERRNIARHLIRFCGDFFSLKKRRFAILSAAGPIFDWPRAISLTHSIRLLGPMAFIFAHTTAHVFAGSRGGRAQQRA